MVTVSFDPGFKRKFQRIRDNGAIRKQIRRIIENPLVGKPMRYSRKGTREVHVGSYRISYGYLQDEIIFLDIYHKNQQ
jgi:mRNA-degrading endonuclease RelE of RelBE toxin-antitoxin system